MAQQQNIVIKKVKKGGHGGHHGGAWKVAYADFVTAMMAFFLLLWLLNAVTEEQLKGIADYFTPTIGINNGKGIGVEGGEREKEEGVKRDINSAESIVYGSPFKGALIKAPEEIKESDEKDVEKIILVESDLKREIEGNDALKEYKDNIIIDQTPEGLRIQITDKDGRSMFKQNTAVLEDYTKLILKKVVKIVRYIPNYISITGHTSATPSISKDYGNWELSADRANATRKYMIQAGMDPEHVAKLEARADNELLDPEHPNAPVNRRISIVILKNTHITNKRSVTPDELLAPDKAAESLYLKPQKTEQEQKMEEEMQTRKAAERIKNNLDSLKHNQMKQ